jgi:NUMOD1 domain
MNYLFKKNKYRNWYLKIIDHAKLQLRDKKSGVFEMHHIVPKSCGGNDTKVNLVLLTPREHFICHLLLIKIVELPDVYKMVAAVARFGKKISSREYSLLRAVISNASKGNKNSSFGRKWMHDPHSKKIYYLLPNEVETIGRDLVYGLPEQRGGHRNTMWITNGQDETLIPIGGNIEGWTTGRVNQPTLEHMRLMSKKRHTFTKDLEHSQKLQGRVSIIHNDTNKCIRIRPDELENYISDGWHVGVQYSCRPKKCMIDGKKFRSVSSASKILGISHKTICKHIESTDPQWSNWNYIGS